jgi:hypothetical protein
MLGALNTMSGRAGQKTTLEDAAVNVFLSGALQISLEDALGTRPEMLLHDQN